MSSVLDRFRLDGQVAIITGGGKGIGAAIAAAFADAGADVVVTARTAADVEHVADDVRSRGRRAIGRPGRRQRLRVPGRAGRADGRELGGVDIVVNNAGGSVSRPFLDTTTDDLASSFHFNVLAPFELSRSPCRACSSAAAVRSSTSARSRGRRRRGARCATASRSPRSVSSPG